MGDRKKLPRRIANAYPMAIKIKSRRNALLWEICTWVRLRGISSGREHQDSRTGEKCVGKQQGNWGYWWRVEDTGDGVGARTMYT